VSSGGGKLDEKAIAELRSEIKDQLVYRTTMFLRTMSEEAANELWEMIVEGIMKTLENRGVLSGEHI
jgi:hypothetical protein